MLHSQCSIQTRYWNLIAQFISLPAVATYTPRYYTGWPQSTSKGKESDSTRGLAEWIRKGHICELRGIFEPPRDGDLGE